MRPPEWTGDEFVEALTAPVEPPFAGSIAVLTSPPAVPEERVRAAVDRLAVLPSVVVAGPGYEPVGAALDLVDLCAASEEELQDVVDGVDRSPLAAQATAVLLRGADRRTVGEGLVVESAVFSALQAGPEHLAWRRRTPMRDRPDDDAPRLAVRRTGDVLEVLITRSGVANALDTRMRDELLEALAVAEADPALRVEIRAEGPTFCAGGDLDEFGTTPDPATAHVVRLRRSVGAVLARLGDRVTAFVRGAAVGSGLELVAFAGQVVAHPEARFRLPELELGLVPGAGGTVSLPRRIGRHRAAWMALTGRAVDAPVARTWGLVDEIRLV
ncbi:MAG: enoyl-CoA hydratase/isomerase family protein [Microthrixaceae bacterium]